MKTDRCSECFAQSTPGPALTQPIMHCIVPCQTSGAQKACAHDSSGTNGADGADGAGAQSKQQGRNNAFLMWNDSISPRLWAALFQSHKKKVMGEKKKNLNFLCENKRKEKGMHPLCRPTQTICGERKRRTKKDTETRSFLPEALV